MRKFTQLISWFAILATIVPSMMYLGNSISLPVCKWVMLIGTVAWFVATPLWMERGSA